MADQPFHPGGDLPTPPPGVSALFDQESVPAIFVSDAFIANMASANMARVGTVLADDFQSDIYGEPPCSHGRHGLLLVSRVKDNEPDIMAMTRQEVMALHHIILETAEGAPDHDH